MQIKQLTYTIRLWDKKGCKCDSTSNCKKFTNDLVAFYARDCGFDLTKKIKTDDGYEYKTDKERLTVDYPIELRTNKEH